MGLNLPATGSFAFRRTFVLEAERTLERRVAGMSPSDFEYGSFPSGRHFFRLQAGTFRREAQRTFSPKRTVFFGSLMVAKSDICPAILPQAHWNRQ
jgi:hypothetical protein